MMQAQPDIQYKSPPALINFFKLRPEMSWFLFSLVLLTTMIFTVHWNNKDKVDESKFQNTPFEMVELKIPEQAKEAEPEIALEEEVEEIVEEKKQLKFGDDSGKWDPSLGKPPIPLYTSYPPYPPALKKAGVEGQIIIELGIDETGKPVYGKIVKPLHPQLDKIVLQWIRKQKFTPAYNADGKPFKVKIFLPILYKLQ